jgi:RluA family pseudouridine synthase
MSSIKKIPKRHQPKGFEVLYEDDHLIVGNKAPGLLTVGALWEREHTVHQLLNKYVRKGNSTSRKRVFVVHRLDQATSGVLMFAKSERVQFLLKEGWKDVQKTYYAIVHGRMPKSSGTISSYLQEDEDYVVHSSADSGEGRLSHTAYTVERETPRFSLLKIDLLTGRKNQIRVHMADQGHPIVGDDKYGRPGSVRYPRLFLHAKEISFVHPLSHKPLVFTTALPGPFTTLLGGR